MFIKKLTGTSIFAKFLVSIGMLFIFQQGSGQLPELFTDQSVDQSWDFPMGITFDGAGRMFVWEKAGKVYIVDTTGVKLQEPLIDLSEEIGNWRDHGLLGFALDPEFLTNGYFYLLYAVDRHHLLYHGTNSYEPDSTSTLEASIGRVTRFSADPNTNFTSTLMDSREDLIGSEIDNGIPLYHESHGVGSLVFGTDGTLLISCGDGNSNQGADIGGNEFGSYAEQALNDGIISPSEDIGSFKAQYIGSLSGKILRIDPISGAGIPSNPFYIDDQPFAVASRIWATGFRNPFRMSKVAGTGSHNPEAGDPGFLFVGDVGASQWEELNIVKEGGQNFGWPLKEGLIPFWGFWGADHPDNVLAPNPLFGIEGCEDQFFDFKDLFAESNAAGTTFFPNPCNESQNIPADVFPKMETIPVLTWGHNEWNLPSKAYIGVYNEDGKLEAIDISSDESPVESDIFDGNSSIAGFFYNGNNFPEAYRGKYFHADYSGWIKMMTFDDNYQLTKVEPFADNVNQIIHLVEHPIDGCLYYLTTKNGGSIRKICYGGNPPPVAIAEADTIYGPSPLSVDFDGSDSYAPFGLPINYQWDFGDGTTSTDPQPTHVFTTEDEQPKSYEVNLIVTDSLDYSSKTKLIISVNNTPPKVDILNPLDSSFYSMNGNTPYRLTALVDDLEHEDSELIYEWQSFLHHNSHVHSETPSSEVSPLVTITPIGCETDATYWFRIQLKVSDPAGLTTIKNSEVFPYCGSRFFAIDNFNGVANTEGVQLNWSVIQAEDVISYEIQRSPYFETIHSIDDSQSTNYSFLDTQPLFGDNYYRIKANRADGVFDYSIPLVVRYPALPELSINPNPFNDHMTISLKQANTEEVYFELFDLSGKSVIQSTWPSTPGEYFEAKIITLDLSSGIYFFEIRNGKQNQSGKIIKS